MLSHIQLRENNRKLREENERLRSHISHLEAHRDGLMDENGRLRAALTRYATELCEGWCKETPEKVGDCGGCLARLTLDKAI